MGSGDLVKSGNIAPKMGQPMIGAELLRLRFESFLFESFQQKDRTKPGVYLKDLIPSEGERRLNCHLHGLGRRQLAQVELLVPRSTAIVAMAMQFKNPISWSPLIGKSSFGEDSVERYRLKWNQQLERLAGTDGVEGLHDRGKRLLTAGEDGADVEDLRI